MLTPLLFGLPLLAAWIWFATRRGLAPLDTVATELDRRTPDQLDPVLPVQAPQEIRPLLEAINGLFGRVTGVLDNERRFTADAAHELRTPLAAILTQTEVAQRARDSAEFTHALAQIAASSTRAARLVDQLLILARLDPAAGIARETIRLDALATAVCADHGAAALEKNITLELDAPAAVTIDGNADLLRILLRNLLDNALRYTPAGGKVGVGVTAHLLVVCDTGPGIPARERENVLCRFHRLAGQETQGSGLGLSIVARIVELHGARLVLEDNAPGLRVQIDFLSPEHGTI
jgi:signal transduction histidine kinase